MSKLSSGRRTGGAPLPTRRLVLPSRSETRDDGDQLHWITARDKYLIRDFRVVMRENQTDFWRRFGVSQTRGSRFERGKPMPLPELMLMRLYLRRMIDDADLLLARSADSDDVTP
ncbi:MAG: hypothetical protein ABW202_12720 [Duganella sp.]